MTALVAKRSSSIEHGSRKGYNAFVVQLPYPVQRTVEKLLAQKVPWREFLLILINQKVDPLVHEQSCDLILSLIQVVSRIEYPSDCRLPEGRQIVIDAS